MARPPNFSDLRRNSASKAREFSSFKNFSLRGASSRVNAGIPLPTQTASLTSPSPTPSNTGTPSVTINVTPTPSNTPNPTESPTPTITPTPTTTTSQPLATPTITPTVTQTPIINSFCITNAGSTVANGSYVETTYVNGESIFILFSNSNDVNTFVTYDSTFSPYWNLITLTTNESGFPLEVYLYANNSSSPNIPTTGWFALTGIEPVPTISIGPCTPTPTESPTPTITSTSTPTVSITRTPNSTPTDTPTQTPTNTPTITLTPTQAPTTTNTPTQTPTVTPTSTSTVYTIWNESIDGSLSNTAGIPTAVTLNDGNGLVIASVAGNSNYFTFTVGNNQILNKILLRSYSSSDNVAWLGIQAGSAWTAGNDQALMLADQHFGPGNINQEILGGAAPYNPGNYTVRVQQLGSNTNYTLEFQV